MRMARRFARHWANHAARLEGSVWYANARQAARGIARSSGHTLATTCGVIAALSPRLGWTHNVNAARAMCEGRATTGIFKASRAKAEAILRGERPLRVLRGPKVRAFYRALMGDETAAVIDVWTARVAGVRPDHVTRRYDEIAAALARGAAMVGTTTARLQATAWVAERGRA